MKSLNEWLKDKGIEELSTGNYGMTYTDDSILDNQLDQLVTRLEGLVYDVENKNEVVGKFIKSVKNRLLK